MASTNSPSPSLSATSTPFVSAAPSLSSSPHQGILDDIDIRGSDLGDNDTEPAVSIDSIDVGLPEDQDGDESWHSWRTRYSDETDISNQSAGSKVSDASRQSVESQASGSSAQTFATDSMSSQDIEVITSPTASMAIHPYDEKSHPCNIIVGDHHRADSSSSSSALPPNRYAYPDSYSEGNPYAYPTTSTAPNMTKEREDSPSPAKGASILPSLQSVPPSADTAADFSSNSAQTVASAPPPPPTATFSNLSNNASVPIRKRLNASIPIINPVDRSIVLTPAMQTKDTNIERGLLTVEEEPSESGDQTVVPSPLPTPTGPDMEERRLEESKAATSDSVERGNPPTGDSVQVVYCAKPPIDLSELMAANQARRVAEVSERDGSVVSVTSNASGGTSHSTFRSPNVYINGLPPYYPEDELLALTSPYGAVRSVRSFTRHVDIAPSAGPGIYGGSHDDGLTLPGKKASGYGFVLFDTVEGAERCIEGLKKYRNLHPSFSKQVHKIPGTPYTAVQPQLTGDTVAKTGDEDGVETDSFKARMEKLEDKTSTNLYIEGLPLSMDGPLLSALVSPYQIKSSRFFQTKLSHPPRIIAFVRLETRAAAEEVIERLHGRMVRGWNDAGSRISVRFADSSDQRELRRNERQPRTGQGAELHSSKLTIAQAALLNLRGRELKHQGPGVTPSSTMDSLSGSPSLSSLASMSNVPASFGRVRKLGEFAAHPVGLRNDFPLGMGNLPVSMSSPAFGMDAMNTSPYISSRFLGGGYDAEDMDRQTQYRSEHRSEHLTAPRAHADVLSGRYPLIGSARIETDGAASTMSNEMNAGFSGVGMGLRGMGIGMPGRQAHLQAFNGYTPAEELLLHAHSASLRNRNHQQQPRPNGFVRSQRGGRVQSSRGTVGDTEHKWRSSNTSSLKSLGADQRGTVDEDDFHSNFRQGRRPLNDDIMPAPKAQSEALSPVTSYHFSRQQQTVPAPQGHVRSTTVPHSNRAQAATRHQQHSSISNPHSTITANNNIDSMTSNDSRMPHNTNAFNKYSKLDSINHDTTATNKVINNSSSVQHRNLQANSAGSQAHHQHQRSPSDLYKDNNGSRNPVAFRRAPRSTKSDNSAQDSPSMVSPTLTCGSQTPSTLSPATPYFGSFASSEGLQNQGKPGMHVGSVEVKGAMNERV